MTLESLGAIVWALDRHRARYVIAGCLTGAANEHARAPSEADLVLFLEEEYEDLVLDLDAEKTLNLVLDLEEQNVRRAMAALGSLGYQPVPPVAALDLANPAHRERWIRENNTVVVSFRSDKHPDTPVEIPVTEPFDFETEYDRALVGEVLPVVGDLVLGIQFRFVRLRTLSLMVEAAGRSKGREGPRDLETGPGGSR